jgi:hypothetical protein
MNNEMCIVTATKSSNPDCLNGDFRMIFFTHIAAPRQKNHKNI